MKLRHFAALALVGWYLIVPPVFQHTTDKSYWVAEVSELSRWKVVDSFDSADDCRAAIADLPKRAPSDMDAKTKTYVQSKALCISTDDPRLKGD